ncbi:MFS general substrate transporter, partial [Pluteus cervinus]
LMSLPFVINAFVGSNIATSILEKSGWRWGYGMFAILVPVSLSPLIITLLWAENKAKKLGILNNTFSTSPSAGTPTTAPPSSSPAPAPAPTPTTPIQKLILLSHQLDILGLLLLASSVSLILLPLTLAQNAHNHWKNPSMIAMLVVGIVLIPAFGVWDSKYAKYPVIPKRFLVNRGVVIAAAIGMFDFMSFYLTFTYLFSFVIVVKPWPLLHATYFNQTQTVGLTVFGIAAGLGMRYLRRYKALLVIGLTIRLLGVGLMIHSRGANASDAELVWTQILQGMGGGFAAVASQVGAQASVPHSDVAMVTAVVLLVTEVGGAIGTAIAGAIWTNTMPGKLEKYLPFLTQAQRDQLYGSIVAAAANPRGDPIREGVIQAYDEVMKIMIIAAACLSVIPLILSLFMPNWYLGDQQNAVDQKGLMGERV